MMLVSNLGFVARNLLAASAFRRRLALDLATALLHQCLPGRRRFPASVGACWDVLKAVPRHFAGISTITGSSMQTVTKWTCSNNLTGAVYNPVSNAGNISKTQTFGTSVSNTTSGGADEFFSFQQAIAGGGSATLNLNTMTNILQQTSVAIVRIKGYQLRLLSTTDDSTITAPAASSVTVTNAGPAIPAALDFNSPGSGLTLTLTTSGGAITGVAIGAAGSGYPPSTSFLVAPNQSGGSTGLVQVNTNSSGVPTSVSLAAAGTGYTNATVACTEVGKYTIYTGGTHVYFDPLAAGFATISATGCNLKIQNNDATNTATIEISVFAGSS